MYHSYSTLCKKFLHTCVKYFYNHTFCDKKSKEMIENLHIFAMSKGNNNVSNDTEKRIKLRNNIRPKDSDGVLLSKGG